MFWVISVYFNIRNTLPKSGTYLLGHPVYDCFVFGHSSCLRKCIVWQIDRQRFRVTISGTPTRISCPLSFIPAGHRNILGVLARYNNIQDVGHDHDMWVSLTTWDLVLELAYMNKWPSAVLPKQGSFLPHIPANYTHWCCSRSIMLASLFTSSLSSPNFLLSCLLANFKKLPRIVRMWLYSHAERCLALSG